MTEPIAPALTRYHVWGGGMWLEQEEAPAEDGAWVKWSDLATYFTQEDVDELRHVATHSEAFATEVGWVSPARRIADKIAALLPPAP